MANWWGTFLGVNTAATVLVYIISCIYYYYYYIDAPGHVGKYFCIKMRPRPAVHSGGKGVLEVFGNLKVKWVKTTGHNESERTNDDRDEKAKNKHRTNTDRFVNDDRSSILVDIILGPFDLFRMVLFFFAIYFSSFYSNTISSIILKFKWSHLDEHVYKFPDK